MPLPRCLLPSSPSGPATPLAGYVPGPEAWQVSRAHITCTCPCAPAIKACDCEWCAESCVPCVRARAFSDGAAPWPLFIEGQHHADVSCVHDVGSVSDAERGSPNGSDVFRSIDMRFEPERPQSPPPFSTAF